MTYEAEALKKHLSEQEYEDLKKCLAGELDLYMDCEELFVNLCDYYADEMPYGTRKARTGDPDVWILERVEEALKDDPKTAMHIRAALLGGLSKKGGDII